MLKRIFPKIIDNTYGGYAIAIWLLVPIALSKLVMGGNSIVNTRYVIEVADRIPVSTFDPGAAATLLFLFRCWGLGLALMSLLTLVAVVRYRAMIPLMYLVLTIEQVVRRGFTLFDPLPILRSTDGPSSGYVVNLVMTVLLLIGSALSMCKPDRTPEASKPATR